jgi:lipocalin
MIRFHYSVGGGDILSLHQGKRLLAVDIKPFETTKYLTINPKKNGKAKITGSTTTGIVFVLTIKLCKDSKYTIQLAVGNQLNVYNDRDAVVDNPGSALVRTISNSSTTSGFKISGLGMQNFTMDGMSKSIDVINEGIYTIFFDQPSNISVVLYNYPPQYQQCNLDFGMYIGLWNVVSSIGVVSKSYTFSETSQGRFMIVGNGSQNSISIASEPLLYSGDVQGTDQAGNVVNLTGLIIGQLDMPLMMEPSTTMPFTWIVHKTDYKTYSLNGTPNRQHMAILSREPRLESCMVNKLIKKARKLGYGI